MKKALLGKIVTCGVAVLLLSLALQTAASAASYNGFTYVDRGTYIEITGYTGTGGAVTIPSTIAGKKVTSIVDNAFYNLLKVTEVTLPSGLTSIGNYAFAGCGITKITIPTSVTFIGGGAFYGCALTSVSIPANVSTLNGSAFSGCRKLSAIEVNTSNLNFSSKAGVLYNKNQTTLLAYPMGKSGVVSIPVSVTTIGDMAFYNNDTLISVSIPSSVRSIEWYAFGNCANLSTVYLYGNAPEVDESAFDECGDCFLIVYAAGRTGYTNPWHGYATKSFHPGTKCTVTFNTMGGNAIASRVLNEYMHLAPPAEPKRTGYYFGGWYLDSGYSKPFYFSGFRVTSSFTLYARWLPASGVFGKNVGNRAYDFEVTDFYGHTVKLSDFLGKVVFINEWATWCTYCDQEMPDIQKIVNENKDIVFLSINCDETKEDVESYLKNRGLSFHVYQRSDSYQKNYSSTGIPRSYIINKNGVISGIMPGMPWSPYETYMRMINQARSETQTCTVTFDSKGGSAVAARTVIKYCTFASPAAPTRTGFAFAGWYRDTGYLQAWNFRADTVVANVKLYAKWKPATYTVSFNPQGGTAVASKTVAYNSTIAAPTAPTRAGYRFGGWYREAACKQAWSFSTNKVTSNLTLYALWTPTTPTKVSAASASYSSVAVSWLASSHAAGYEVYRSDTQTGTYSLVGTTTSTRLVNSSLTCGKTYYFKVRAYLLSGGAKVCGAYTLAVSTRPVPTVPAGCKAVAISDNKIRISWGAVNGATKYEVYRASSKSGTYQPLGASTSSTFLVDASLTAGKTGWYKVRACRQQGSSTVYGSFSSPVSATAGLAAPALKVTLSGTTASLSFNAITNASGYEISRCTATLCSLLNTALCSYSDAGLKRGTSYAYKVRAFRYVDGKKEYGAYSNEVKVTP